MIVDDNTAFAENLGEILELEGLQVQVLNDPLHALELAPSIDPSLVLIDVRMRRMDGIRLHGRLKELLPEARFVLMSAYSFPPSVQGAIDAGVILLEKPFDIEVLLNLARGDTTELHPARARLRGRVRFRGRARLRFRSRAKRAASGPCQ